MKRRKFSREFKREAAAMTEMEGATVRQVASDLAIGEGLLGRWRRELQRHGDKAYLGQGQARDEEIARLKRELARVRKERIFSRSVLRESIEMRCRMIERCRDAFPLRMMCRCLEVSSSGYYGWCNRPASVRMQATAGADPGAA